MHHQQCIHDAANTAALALKQACYNMCNIVQSQRHWRCRLAVESGSGHRQAPAKCEAAAGKENTWGPKEVSDCTCLSWCGCPCGLRCRCLSWLRTSCREQQHPPKIEHSDVCKSNQIDNEHTCIQIVICSNTQLCGSWHHDVSPRLISLANKLLMLLMWHCITDLKCKVYPLQHTAGAWQNFADKCCWQMLLTNVADRWSLWHITNLFLTSMMQLVATAWRSAVVGCTCLSGWGCPGGLRCRGLTRLGLPGWLWTRCLSRLWLPSRLRSPCTPTQDCLRSRKMHKYAGRCRKDVYQCQQLASKTQAHAISQLMKA